MNHTPQSLDADWLTREAAKCTELGKAYGRGESYSAWLERRGTADTDQEFQDWLWASYRGETKRFLKQ